MIPDDDMRLGLLLLFALVAVGFVLGFLTAWLVT